MKNFNIVFLGRTPFPNGAAMSKRHKYIIDYLCTKDDVRVYKYASWNNKGWNNPDKGLYKEKVEYVNTKYSKSFFSLMPICIECCRFLKHAFHKGEDNILVVSMVQYEQIVPFLYAKKLGYKVVFDLVENFEVKGGDSTFFYTLNHKISNLFLGQGNGFFVISSFLEKWHRERNHIPICLLPNSVPMQKKRIKEKFSVPMRIVYAGTFASKDGVHYLIEGFDKFVRQNSFAEVELRLMGIGKVQECDMKIINNNSAIKVLGFVEEGQLREELANADVLAMTRCNSKFANYGFPFKLSEYLATGNTVIATKVGDVPKYLEDKKNAYLIAPEDSDAICNILIHICAHQEEAIQVGINGQEVVLQYFNQDVNGLKFYKFLKSLSEV